MSLDDWLKEQAQFEVRAQEAQAKAAHAFARLLDLAESDSGQAQRVRRFLAATYDGDSPGFNLFDLRGLDVPISDDVLLVMDALRWARTDVYRLIPDGYERLVSLLERWGLGRRFSAPPDS